MRSDCNDLTEITVSVVGLSGSANLKGLVGIGKSYLCHKLAQPDRYVKKYNSAISQMDFYGPVINQSHWLYWGTVDKNINYKKFKFNIIEKTAFVDNTTYIQFPSEEPSDYSERCKNIVFNVKKQKFQGDFRGKSGNNEYICDNDTKLIIDVFLLVYDVSLVERRDPNQQDVVFKNIFDNIVGLKKPIIIIITKFDILNSHILTRLNHILEKKPFSKYPVIQTSAVGDVNIESIFSTLSLISAVSLKNIKQRYITFDDGIKERDRINLDLLFDFKKLIRDNLDVNLFCHWVDMKNHKSFVPFVSKLGGEYCENLFNEMKNDIILKLRNYNFTTMRKLFYQLLLSHKDLLQESIPIELVIQNLKANPSFMSHFIEFKEDYEHFKFDENSTILPLNCIDSQNQLNVLDVISEFIYEQQLSVSLFNDLLNDWESHYKKPLDDIKSYLESLSERNLNNIADKIYQNFKSHCKNRVIRRFIEKIHQHPNVFWSHSIFTCIDIYPQKPWRQNVIDKSQVNGDLLTPTQLITTTTTGNNIDMSNTNNSATDATFIDNIIRELNGRIRFNLLPIKNDHQGIREHCIKYYLNFLLSSNMYDCIYRDIGMLSNHDENMRNSSRCSFTELTDTISDLHLPIVSMSNNCHAHSTVDHLVLVVIDVFDHSPELVGQLSELRREIEDYCMSDFVWGFCTLHDCHYRLQICQNHSEITSIVRTMCNTDNRSKINSICQNLLICTTNINTTDYTIFDKSTPFTDIMQSLHDINGFNEQAILPFCLVPQFDYPQQLVDPIVASEESTQLSKSIVYTTLEPGVGSVIIRHIQYRLKLSQLWIVSFCGGDNFDDSVDCETYGNNVSVISYIVDSISSLSVPGSVARLNSSDQVSIVGKFQYTNPFNDVNNNFNSNSSNPYFSNFPNAYGPYYRLVFLSYHQAIKLLLQSINPPNIDGLLLLPITTRQSSLNTLTAIKQSLPQPLSTKCSTFMLACHLPLSNSSDNTSVIRSVTDNSKRAGIECDIFDCSDPRSNSNEKLCGFFTQLFFKKCSPNSSLYSTLKSDNFSTNLSLSTEDSNSIRCKLCCESCRKLGHSGTSLVSKSHLKDWNNDTKSMMYDSVIGRRHEELFKPFLVPEFNFHIVQDTSMKCTKMKCKEHWNDVEEDEQIIIQRTFRTRVRSQSGPDLRSDINNVSHTNMSCDYCGRIITQTCGHSNNHNTKSSTSVSILNPKYNLSKLVTSDMNNSNNSSNNNNHINTGSSNTSTNNSSSCNNISPRRLSFRIRSSIHNHNFNNSKSSTTKESSNLPNTTPVAPTPITYKKFSSKLHDFFTSYLKPSDSAVISGNVASAINTAIATTSNATTNINQTTIMSHNNATNLFSNSNNITTTVLDSRKPSLKLLTKSKNKQ